MTTKAHNTKVNRERGDMNLVKLIEKFGSEDRCRNYLQTLRWPDGVECPQCGSKSISTIQRRKPTAKGRLPAPQLDCNSCRYRFSVTAGTIFHDSHLPLWKWFLATYMMIESKKGMSANQLKRTLAVSYKTAWYLCHRIRSAMVDDGEPISGTIEADETYVGGKSKGFRTMQEAALGRMANKSVVLGAVARGGKLRVRVVKDNKNESVHRFLEDTVEDETSTLYSDAHHSYRKVPGFKGRHEYVDHSADEWVRGDVHTNTIESAWSLFDRAVIGSYHQLSRKHLPAYLQEFEFRFNNRENPFLFRDTLWRLIQGENLPYSELVAD